MARGGALPSKTPGGTFLTTQCSARVNTRSTGQTQGEAGEASTVNPKRKPKRRSAEEIEEDNRQKQKDQQAAAKEAQKSLEAVGRVEDNLRREDMERNKPRNRREENATPFSPPLDTQANTGDMLQADTDKELSSTVMEEDSRQEAHMYTHPLPHPKTTRPTIISRQSFNIPATEDILESDLSGDDGNYSPSQDEPQEEEEGDGSDGESDEHSDVEGPGIGSKRKLPTKSGKSKSARRADIQATRTLPDQQNVSAVATKGGRKKKPDQESLKKRLKKSERGVDVNWKPPTQAISASRLPLPRSSSTAPDDSMFQYGSYAGEDEEEEVAVGSRAKVEGMGKFVQITPGHVFVPMTKKAQRGGESKWKLHHLPDSAQTGPLFTQHVTPLAKIKAGTIAPWASLEVVHIQEILDTVYGEGRYNVKEGDVWCGLVAARLSNWRNAFASAATQGCKLFIQENPELRNSPETIVETVTLYLSEHDNPAHRPFWWREWEKDEVTGKVYKKGMFQQPMILYTLGMAHFIEYNSVDEIPDPLTTTRDEMPVGALILALQAVEYALKRWQTGAYMRASTASDYFSFDNYGDITEKRVQLTGTTKKLVSTFVPRASKFMPRARGLKDEHWTEIFSSATDFLVRSKKKRRSHGSNSTIPKVEVDEGDDTVSEYALDEFTFASDDGPFGAV